MKTSEEHDLLLVAALQELARQPVPEADEGRLAALSEQWQSGKKISAEDTAYILALYPIVKQMQGPLLSVPEALTAAVGRYFQAEKKVFESRESGSIIVKLGAGLELIASTLMGLEPVFVAVTPTRRSNTETAKRLTMNEALQGGGLIEYSILRSTEDTVMVSLFFQDLKEALTVRLSENDRPVSAQTVRDASGRIHFDGLTSGEYRIDMSGSMDRSFTLRLLGPAD